MEKCFVLLRAYNVEQYIKKAIDSVLKQDYPNVELLVLDDGSTDRTAEIVCGYDNPKIRYTRCENKGPAGAFRVIAAETLRRADKNDYIFSLDGDDFYTREDALSGTVKKMKALDANLCIIGMEFSGDKNFVLQPNAGKKHNDTVKKLAARNRAENIMTAPFIIDADTALCSKVYRRDMFAKYINLLPEFAPDLKVCEDFPTTVALLMKDARVTANPDIFYGYYKHGGSVTSKPKVADFERDRIQFLKITQQLVAQNPQEFFAVAPCFVNKFIRAKYEIISGIVDNKVKNGALPADYSKKQFQETFRREINLDFLKSTETEKTADDQPVNRADQKTLPSKTATSGREPY